MKHPEKRAEDYRLRAEELRTIGESWVDSTTKEVLGKIADDYDHMAQYLERKSQDGGAAVSGEYSQCRDRRF